MKKIIQETQDSIRNFIRVLQHGAPDGRAAFVPLATLIAVYSLSVVTSLPGLAIAPILSDLQAFFKGSSELKIQMLESLPSLIIIPFILISGTLSVRFNKRTLLLGGLGAFFLSSVLYLVSENLNFMLFNSVLLGVGAGVVIPLSTGLIADFFSGDQRTRQLGIVSAISNLALVGATMLAGLLADISWRYSFLVYTISLVSLGLTWWLKPSGRQSSASPSLSKVETTPAQSQITVLPTSETTAEEGTLYKPLLRFNIRTTMPIGLMLFYFFITTIVLVIPFNLSIYTQHFHSASVAVGGTMISVFFLSITVPGLLINRIKERLGERVFFYGVCTILLGLVLLLMPMQQWAIWAGITLSGFGYGMLQPLIYDRTAAYVPVRKVTFALSWVMAMNYIAIIVYPFFQELQTTLARWHSPYLPFVVSAAMALIYVATQVKKIKNKA